MAKFTLTAVFDVSDDHMEQAEAIASLKPVVQQMKEEARKLGGHVHHKLTRASWGGRPKKSAEAEAAA